MRPGQQKQRGRGRNNNNNNGGGGNNNNNNHNRKGQNPLTRTYDSSGPDVKIRGTAQHIAEKYMNLARDAQSSGDRVVAENYLQHAEHYNRIILAAQAQMQERFQRDDRQEFGERDADESDETDNEGDSESNGGNNGFQPSVAYQGNRPNSSDEQAAQTNGEFVPRRDQQQQRNRDHQRQPDQNRSGEMARNDDNPRRNDRNDRNDRNNRGDNPRNPPRNLPPHIANPVADAMIVHTPVYDGSGPQPVIDGTPAEVSFGQETPTHASGDRTPARRRGPPRPRRVPRRGDGEAETGSDSGADTAAVLVTSDAD